MKEREEMEKEEIVGDLLEMFEGTGIPEIKLLNAVFKLDRRLRAIRRAMQEGINQNLKLNEKEAEEMTKVLNKCREEIENHVITRTKTHGKGENLWT